MEAKSWMMDSQMRAEMLMNDANLFGEKQTERLWIPHFPSLALLAQSPCSMLWANFGASWQVNGEKGCEVITLGLMELVSEMSFLCLRANFERNSGRVAGSWTKREKCKQSGVAPKAFRLNFQFLLVSCSSAVQRCRQRERRAQASSTWAGRAVPRWCRRTSSSSSSRKRSAIACWRRKDD